jgi:hypothetical protein
VDPRRVDEHQLRLGQILDPENPVAGRLRLVGDDRPMSWLSSVDFPAFGRPTSEM